MSIQDALQDGGTITVELHGLERIVDQLELIGLACGRIADSLPIPFVPVAELEQRRDENFRTALQIVRDVLDSGGPGLPGSPNAERLFAAEALLSAELGQPVWEGRRS